MSDAAATTLPVLPLREQVLFPGALLPIDVGRLSSRALIDAVGARQPARLLIATQKDPKVDEPRPEDLHPLGVEAELVNVVKHGDQRITILVRGLERRRLGGFAHLAPYLAAESHAVEQTNPRSADADALAMLVRETIHKTSALSRESANPLFDAAHEPARLADLAAAGLEVSTDERAALLAELDVPARLRAILTELQHRLQVLQVRHEINAQVHKELSRNQREAVLRQKLKAVRAELGEAENGDDASHAELAARLEAAGMPAEVKLHADKQLARLRWISVWSPEHAVARTYLERLAELPWSKRTTDRLDVAEARRILDEDHYDLQKIKKRILEYLAVRKLAPGKRGPILCLVGPPGAGKTSLGRSIARALGREFVRISLGGVQDEAEIRGHRRTYIGALPGRIIAGLKRAGTRNPVFMLDEVDKLGGGFRGDPSAALLEVLDAEENDRFSDHYLEVPFDLSEVMFIATANDLAPLAPALRDRLEVLELSGYTSDEKRRIAERYLVPKQVAEHGLTEHHVALTSPALDEIIDHYTREAGVRNLERELANVIRGVAVEVASGSSGKTEIGAAEVAGYLGPPRFFSEMAERTDQTGVATGLCWTPTGGEILFIEVTRMPGKGALTLTGQLGDVMKESAQAALSYVRAHAATWGIPVDFLERSDLHVHVPAGGVPKEGPSAGNALVTALVSLLTGRRVRGDVAMTGEITLRGAVLPVGGIKSKLLAAHRAGIARVILPARNRQDLIDLPDDVRRELDLVLVNRVEETLAAALEEAPAAGAPPPVRELYAEAIGAVT